MSTKPGQLHPPYPSTKHTSANILKANGVSYEDIKKYGTGHQSNKAMDRYLHASDAEDRKISRILRAGNEVMFDKTEEK